MVYNVHKPLCKSWSLEQFLVILLPEDSPEQVEGKTTVRFLISTLV